MYCDTVIFFLFHDLWSLPRKFLSEYIKAIEILEKYRVQQSGLDLFYFSPTFSACFFNKV